MRFCRWEWITLAIVSAFWAILFAGAGMKATRNQYPEARYLHFAAGLSLFSGVNCLRRASKPYAVLLTPGLE